jgi:thiol-disulfide isomerase/thioredoxin
VADRRPRATWKRAALGLCALPALALCLCATARAADPKVEPAAEKVLRRMTDRMKNAKAVAVDMEVTQKLGRNGMSQPLKMAYERPNRFAIQVGQGVNSVELVSDGKSLFVSMMGKYTEEKAPASFEEVKTNPVVMAMTQMVRGVFGADPYADLVEGVRSVKYVGNETLDGVKADHLALAQDPADFDMWIASEGEPVILRNAADLTRALARSPGADRLKGQKVEMVQTFKNWRVDKPLPASTFAFTPPRGAQKVDELFKKPGGGDSPSPLLGKPAPDISLKLLDKGRFNLSDYRGTRLVMLDFWATWCGPCVQELPLLAEVAREYEPKGVAFVAVNMQEEPAEVREFLAQKKLNLTVALDSQGDAGSAYKAEAIPLLVLVDRAGVVQAVHLGYDPQIKTTLRKELDALLQGKDLAGEALRKAGKDAKKP